MSRTPRVGICLAIPIVLVAFFAPLIANDRPILAELDGRIVWPALGQLPVAGWMFDSAEFEGVAWNEGETTRVILGTPVSHSYRASDIAHRLNAPSRSHWLGTDGLGRDLLARVVWGARVSIFTGLFSMLIAVLIAIFFGCLSGYYGGPADAVISRLIDVVLSFPSLILVLALVGLDPPILRSMPAIMRLTLVIGLTGWTGMARFIRSEFMRLGRMEFAIAARASGAGDLRIIARHLLPGAIGTVLVSASLFVAHAVLLEAAISFLGFGIQPPVPSWGSLLAESQEPASWWLVLAPGIALFLTVMSCNLLGEGLRTALEPRLRFSSPGGIEPEGR